MGDRQILDLFFARSQEALELVRAEYGGRLQRLAENILGNRLDAEECVDDALLAAWNAIPPQRPLPLLPWLATAVRNQALKRYRWMRAQKRGGGAFSAAYDELEEIIATQSGPEEAVDARELARLLNRFVGRLSPKDRMLFLGRYWYGESYETLAQRLGLSEHGCVVRLGRVRKKLAETLKKEGVL